MVFELSIIGSSSATPVYDRFPTAQVLNHDGDLYLIDCGEGTQVQLIRLKVKFHKIDHIFISHLHGDHYLGLVGLIFSLNLNGRTKPLYIFGPPGLMDIIEVHQRISAEKLRFEIIFHQNEHDGYHKIFETNLIEVYTFPLNHRIPTTGFLFKEKPKKRKLNSTEINRYQVPISYFEYLQKGADWHMSDGFLVENSKLTIAPPPPRSYAFVSDTRYLPELTDFLTGTDLIYHEATFMQDMFERAVQTLHSTSEEAATFAKMTSAKQLILGHFSARYIDLNPLLKEAQAIFPNTELAKEGCVFQVGKPE